MAVPVIIRVSSPQIIGAVTRFSTDLAEVPDPHDITLDQVGDGGTIVLYNTTRWNLVNSENWKSTILPALNTYFEWSFLPNGGRISPGVDL